MAKWIYYTSFNQDRTRTPVQHLVLPDEPRVKAVCGNKIHPEWEEGDSTDLGNGATCVLCLARAVNQLPDDKRLTLFSKRQNQIALNLLLQMRENGAWMSTGYGEHQPWVLDGLHRLNIDEETAEFLEGLWNA